MRKRLLSILLAVAMCLSLLPVGAMAAGPTLYVGTEKVNTSTNDYGDGWSYSASTNILTLDNYNNAEKGHNYHPTYSSYTAGIYADGNLRIELKGSNSISGQNTYGIFVSGNLTFVGDNGSLDLAGGGGINVSNQNDITIEDVTINITSRGGTTSNHSGIFCKDITIKNSTVTVESVADGIAAYNEVEIQSGTVTAGGKDNGISGSTITISGGMVVAEGETSAFNTAPTLSGYSSYTWTGKAGENYSGGTNASAPDFANNTFTQFAIAPTATTGDSTLKIQGTAVYGSSVQSPRLIGAGWAFNPSTSTLTVNSELPSDATSNYGIEFSGSVLNLVVQDAVTIAGTQRGISVDGNLNITGTGSLTASGGTSSGIYITQTSKTLTIGETVNVTAISSGENGIFIPNGSSRGTIDLSGKTSGTLIAQGYYAGIAGYPVLTMPTNSKYKVAESADAASAKGYTTYSGQSIDGGVVKYVEIVALKPHTHSWSDKWSSDNTVHWHNCTAADCTVADNSGKDGYATHSAPADDGNCTTAVKCKICGYEVTAAKTHSFETACDTSCNNADCNYTRTITHSLTKTNAVAATCETAGNEAYWTCGTCGKFFSNAAGTTEVEKDSWIISALTHNYGASTYTWSADNSTCTAERVCANDSSHKETETVNSDSQVTQQQTCVLPELTKYTATFTNSAFDAQTKADVQTKAVMAHNYTYTAAGAVITESCGNGCGHSVTATINAPAGTVIYDGDAKVATVTTSGDWKGGDLEISYSANGNINAGEVTASIAKGELTASVTYTIEEAEWTAKTATGSAKYGNAGTVDLSGLIAPGGQVGTITVTDANSVLYGTPNVTGTTLSYTFVNDIAKVGKTAEIMIPVTGATNYSDYNITVTVTVLDKEAQSNFKFAEDTQTKTYGDADFTIAATGAVDGSTVTYASGNEAVATVENTGKVHIVGAGEATITATAAATDEYAEATATYALTVNKATITITAVNKSAYVGDTAPVLPEAPVKDTDYTVVGLKGDDTIGGQVVLAWKDDATLDMTKAGEYEIVPSGATASDNYTITYVNGKLTISNRPTGGGGGGGYVPPVTEIKSDGSSTGANLDKLVSGNLTLTVNGQDGAQLVFSTEALKGIDSQASGSITVKIDDVSKDHQDTQEGRVVYSLTVTSGGKTISQFNGAVEVQLPYTLKAGERAEDVQVWKLNGTELTEVPTTYNGKVATVTLRSFSEYVVGVKEQTPWVNPFTDVTQADWFYASVEYVNQNGLMNGVSATKFAPSDATTRAMVWTLLARQNGVTISGDTWMEQAQAWAVEKGVSDGTNPTGNVTREQLATMIFRYAGLMGYDTSAVGDLSKYQDGAEVSTWALEGMTWSNGAGLITGDQKQNLNPTDNANRAEVATILMRFVEGVEK